MGRNIMPIIKNAGKTLRGVKTGCHAGSRCCRNAPSNLNYINTI